MITLQVTEAQWDLLTRAVSMEWHSTRQLAERWAQTVQYAEQHPPLPEYAGRAAQSLQSSRQEAERARMEVEALHALHRLLFDQRLRLNP